MKKFITVKITIYFFMVASICISTAKDNSTDTIKPIKDIKQEDRIVDKSDPKAVARAFIIAVANKNIENALEYILPEQRIELAKELKKGLPVLPKNPEIEFKIKEDGIRADVAILNAKPIKAGGPPMGLDMVFKDKKWWIVK
jgi:hypothetical protein